MANLTYSRATVDELQRAITSLRDHLSSEFTQMDTQVEIHISGWSPASESRQAQIRQRKEMQQRFDQLMDALTQASDALERVSEAGYAAESRCVVLMSER
ncbi:hypothetical protein [Schaalia sp. Marseille-Q2122]|uniref:hypothetical protein n=1 Tax=Schaalia sp. Marseille-Q2122 TaxID=2736604 RepID=UPI001588F314|nr:hypothetical protein [Schaalia sp. Marseille-Q2122]